MFTILYDNHKKAEHFIAPNPSARELWIRGLEHFMKRYAEKTQYHLFQEGR